MNEIKVKAVYDSDTRRTHRYSIRSEDIQGSIYIAKTMKVIPKTLTIELVVEQKK